eukprot:CAMPEP_0115852212 /NCGR_PEP_ID=MMETSP0287-20121206/12880_1 /TAXON_ID=412157 /ORGANISM="Chrysochromulina rotalis, Strain UIO044" /LENGTH=323 /DNA_ID=CAMNT_0003306267 /DNA_START=9 /DNA_END=980 /DNA_ORIENTATION=-
MTTIGFIGLGIMGDGMARRLISTAGRKLVVWNRTKAKADALVAEVGANKATVANTPAEVIAACDITYVMLSTPEAVKECYEMDGGVLAGVAAGKCIVDCATLAVEDMVRISKQVVDAGGRFLEAPVSGSKGPAAQGQLIFLCGGDEALYGTCVADLDAMGKAKFFFGAAGSGTRMKLCVNMVMGSMMASYGEGFCLAQGAGLDPSQLLQVLDLGVCGAPLLKLKGAKMLAGDHAPNFPLKHAQKDMRLACALGKQVDVALPVAAAADSAMKAAMQIGDLADKDFSATLEGQKKNAVLMGDKVRSLTALAAAAAAGFALARALR